MFNKIQILMGVFWLIFLRADLSFKERNYFIKSDYISRTEYLDDNETLSTDECQDEVYQIASSIAKKINAQIIADVGCGSGYKLLKYFSHLKTYGFEIEPNYSFLKRKYPNLDWIFNDFSSDLLSKHLDIIICSDVIEHLTDPDILLNWLNSLNFDYLVISTPDRDLLPSIQGNNKSLQGPPNNPHHIREWNFMEFSTYISQYFKIIKALHTKKEWWGQTIICIKKTSDLTSELRELGLITP